MVTFSGSNGAGKSTRSAHLLFLLHRQGKRPLLWVRESDLTQEKESFGPRPLFTNAVGAGALVIDELGSTRGRISDVEMAFDVMLNLIDRRLTARRPTIITTHRALSKSGAKRREQAESESLEALAPAIYDRLKEGLIIGLPPRSHRGQWALDNDPEGIEE